MNIKIEKLSQQGVFDFSELLDIFKIVFDIENLKRPAVEYLYDLLGKPNFLVVVAKDDNKVVGGLTVYILDRYYSIRQSAYIYDVGVRPEFQGKGIGKALVEYVLNYCKENGFEDAFVQAETSDRRAINFYKKTGFSNQLQATHFTYVFETGNING